MRNAVPTAQPCAVATARDAEHRALARDAGEWRRTSVQLLREVRRGFFQDHDLFGLIGKLALEPGIFLAELSLAVSDGLLVCRLRSPLIDLHDVQADLAGCGRNTDSLRECQSHGTILCAVVGPLALGHLNGGCPRSSPSAY